MRIRDVGQDPLEQPVRLVEARGPLRPSAARRRASSASSARPAAMRWRATSNGLPPDSRRASAARECARSRFGDRVAGDRLLGQGVPPRVLIARAPLLVEKLLRNGLLERRQHGLLVRLRHLDEQPVSRTSARAPLQPAGRRCARRPAARDGGARSRARSPGAKGIERTPVPAGVRLKDLTAVDRLPQHLLEDERVPFRPLVDEGGELRAHVVGAQDRRDHLRDLRLRHRLDRDRVGEPAAPPGLDGARQRVEPVELVASVGREEQHTALREAPGCVLEELTRGAVGPVDVVEDDEQGLRAGPEVEQRDERLEEAQPRPRLVTRFRRGPALAELWEDLGQLRHHRAELGAQRVEILRVELRPIASTNGR